MGISWNKLGLGRKEIRIVDLMDFIFFLVFEQNLKLISIFLSFWLRLKKMNNGGFEKTTKKKKKKDDKQYKEE